MFVPGRDRRERPEVHAQHETGQHGRGRVQNAVDQCRFRRGRGNRRDRRWRRRFQRRARRGRRRSGPAVVGGRVVTVASVVGPVRRSRLFTTVRPPAVRGHRRTAVV